MSMVEKNSGFSRELYPSAVGGWTRSALWARSARPNHFEAAYSRDTYGPQTVKVYVRDCYFLDEAAASFEVAMQLRKANASKMKRERSAAR